MRSHRTIPLVFVFLMAYACFGGEGKASSSPRIISLYAAHTEVLLRLGARDNIVGVSRQETYDGLEMIDWSAPTFTAKDDAETFLAACPDIVLVRPQHVADGKLAAALEAAGIRVVSRQVTRADELYGYWRELGSLVDREAEAEAMIARFDAEVECYRQAAALVDDQDKPGVFIEAMHREVKTFTPDSLPVWVVSLAGGRNVAADAKAASPGVVIADYGPERLLDKADDVAVFISQEGPMNRVRRETLLERPIYAPLAAFRNGKVYKIPEAVFARPTPSLLEGLRLVAGWTGFGVQR